MIKVDDGEKKKEKELKKKIMSFIVASNVVASRLPECQPTETLIAHDKRENDFVYSGH